MEHPFFRFQQLCAFEDVVHWRCSEHIAGAGCIQHPWPDRHDVSRFMAAAGTLDDRDEVVIGSSSAMDDVVAWYVLEPVRVDERDAFQHLGDEAVRLIEKLIHSCGG